MRAVHGPRQPAGYVSSVTYGRMLIMKVETDESERDLRAALDLAFSKVSVSADVAAKNVLKNSTFSVFVLGGSPDDAARIQASDAETRASALAGYIQNGANFDPKSPGVPISYTVRRLADNETIKVSSTIDYQVPVCTPAPVNVALDMQKLFIRKDGKAGGSTTGNYEVWLESSTPAAAPRRRPRARPTPASARSSPRHGGHQRRSAIPLGQKSFARVNSQQGATLTIGAKLHSDAKGKECEMTRTHAYRFNPRRTSASGRTPARTR